MMTARCRALALVGPTGVGKTDLAARLARRIPSEIVSVDSMQVYRGMDMGTSKPPASLRREIPHHGLDLVEPEEPFDVAEYVRRVGPEMERVWARGRLPILAGGSGLYFRALVDGICRAPGRDASVRERLIWEGERLGAPALHARLQTADPAAARRLHPNDLRRIVRALEVFEVTGRPISQWQRETTAPSLPGDSVVWLGLTQPRQRLYQRIRERVDRWLSSGWVEEARGLFKRSLSQTARQALGYRELFAHFREETDWEATRALIHRNSCRYAKRQWSWFRSDPRVSWLELEDGNLEAQVERLAGRLLAA